MASLDQILTLSKLVFDFYNSKVAQGKIKPILMLPDSDKIADVLKIVLNDEFFAKFKDPKVGDVLDAVQAFQRTLSPIPGVFNDDGFIGLRLASAVSKMIPCKGEMKWTPTTEKVVDTSEIGVAPKTIRYFFRPEFFSPPPQIASAKSALVLVRNAIFRWRRVAKINVAEAPDISTANLVFTQEPIDGVSGVLADAHVGPPDGFVRTLRLDIAEHWDEDKFLFTVAHEFGHVLGLQHIPGTGNLMSTIYQPGIPGPTATDLAALKDLGYELETTPLT